MIECWFEWSIKCPVRKAFLNEPNENIAQGFEGKVMRLPRGKMLGGSTSINYMAYVRGHPGDFNKWAADGATGWGWDDVLPFFKKSEQFSPRADAKVSASEHGTDGPWTVSHRVEQLPTVPDFLAATEKLGFEVGDCNSRAGRCTAAKGIVSEHQFTVRNGQRCSTYVAFLQVC